MGQDPPGSQLELPGPESTPPALDPKRFLERLLAGSSNLVYIYDLTTRSNVYANRHLLELLGYEADQVRDLGTELMASILHPDDVAAVARHHASFAHASDAETRVLAYRVRHADGHWRWLQSRDVVYARREDGTASQILGTAEDITLERRSLEALQASEEKFRSIVQASPVAKYFYRLEADGRLVMTGANPSADRIIGIEHAALVGKSLEEAFPGLVGTAIPGLYREVARGDLDQQTFEISYDQCGIRGYFEVLVFRTGQDTIAVDFLDISARKESEAALRESEFFFKESQRAGAVGSYKCDFVAGTWKSSEVLDGIFGIDGHYGRTIAGWLELIHPEDTGMMSRYLTEEVLGQRQPFSREYRIIRKADGDIRWVHGLGRVGCDPQGSVISLTGTIQDITERKQAEIELRESYQFSRTIIESLHEGVIVYGTDLRYRVWNSFMARLSGLQPEEVLGKRPLEVFPFLKETGVLERIGRALAGETPDPVEFPFSSRGNSGWTIDTCRPLRNLQGEVLGVIGTVTDISERKLVEEASRESSWRMQLATDSAKLAIWDWDLQAGTMIWDDRMFEIYGATRGEVIGTVQDWKNGLHPEDLERAIGECEAAIRGEAPFDTEFRIRHQDGTVLWVKANATVLRDAEGNPARMVGVNRDVTDVHRFEEEKARLQAQLLQSQKMDSLGTLAGGVAHDMNNVLGAILALTTTHLASLPRDTPVYASLETIRDAAARGGDMVKRLLAFSRQTPSERQELDLNALLLEEVRLLERTTLAKVHLEMDFDPELHPVLGDGSALAHAVMNLCVNAVDAMGDGGTLAFRTRNLGLDQVQVTVADNGCGMSGEVLSRSMEPFFTTKAVGKGTGLGLSLVFATVKAHGGQLDLESQPGRGTRVTLTLPATAAQGRRPGQGAAVSAEAKGHAMQVLLVDDDELIQKATRLLVEALGHAVTLAASGEAALAALEQGLQPDVVILDMNMPGMGGKGALPRLRRLCPTVPVLLATGRADQEALDLVASQPLVALLSKPFSFEDLQDHLRQISEQR
jgi:PAS domain S-box-containing protein